MVSSEVPKDHPLTLEEHGHVVYVVRDEEGKVFGCYSSLLRAVAYIQDWTENLVDNISIGVGISKVKAGYQTYEIVRTTFRD